MNERVYNFCAGPCMLPLEVLQEVQEEFLNYHGLGCSLIEISHRSAAFNEIHNQALDLARELLQVPDDFAALLLPAGGSFQFCMTALHLLHGERKAAFIRSGHWADKAYQEAGRIGHAYLAWDGAPQFTRLPQDEEIKLEANTRYLHLTANETIGGVEWSRFPQLDVPLVVDASSDYFTRPIDWHNIDILYGGTQKNLAPSGITLVFIRRSVLADQPPLPRFLSYSTHSEANSLYNTPPTFQIYVLQKVLKWIKAKGGVPYFRALSEKKSSMIYQVIDEHPEFYKNPIEPAYRSQMNVPFWLPNARLTEDFLAGAAERHMINLKGHRVSGGIRASLYNAMPIQGVETLAQFMRDFAKDQA